MPLRGEFLPRVSGLAEGPSGMARSTSGALVNWMLWYSTTWMWLPQGSTKSRPRPGRIWAPASLSARRSGARSSTTRPRCRSWSFGLGAAGRERDELVAHVEERHGLAPTAQGEIEQAAVEGERFVEVADLERDVVDPDQTRLASLGHRAQSSNTSRSIIAETV